jgi:co-chaperonin GroES (HSP10)
MEEINKSGLQPVEYKILIKLDKVSDRTAGGLYIPISVVKEREMKQVQATLISVGGNAFEDWAVADRPKPGDRIYIAKAAGYEVIGVDKEVYRVANDKDIALLIKGVKHG